MSRREELRRDELVERCWPYDGPHDAETVIDAGRAVADLVRYLNNATQGSALRHPADLYTVVASTALSVHRMGQLFDQLAAQLKAGADLNYPVGIFDDRWPDADPEPTMRQAWTVLWEGQDIALGLGVKLDLAAQVLSHLALDDEAGDQR